MHAFCKYSMAHFSLLNFYVIDNLHALIHPEESISYLHEWLLILVLAYAQSYPSIKTHWHCWNRLNLLSKQRKEKPEFAEYFNTLKKPACYIITISFSIFYHLCRTMFGLNFLIEYIQNYENYALRFCGKVLDLDWFLDQK